jgi:integrase/recombinase XerD
MPADDGLGLHEDESRAPARPRAGQQCPEHPIACAQTWPHSALQCPQLLPQGHVLEHEVVMSATRHHDRAYDQQDQFDHEEILASVVQRINVGWNSGERHVTADTLKWYRVAFQNFRALRGDDALPTKAMLQQFVVALRGRGIRPVTCNTYISAMNAFCAWLQQEGHIAAPVKLSKLRVEHRILALLDDAHMRSLIRFRPRTFRQARTHLAACLILDTDLRISEALHLRQDDIDYNNLVLKVFGRGQKERLVPFSHELRARLYRFAKWQAQKDIHSDLVVAGFHGAAWEKRNSTTSLHLLQRTLGLPRFGWHRLRHTFATNDLRNGGEIVRLSLVLGHTQITTTQRYLHLVTDDLQIAHQRVSILRRFE